MSHTEAAHRIQRDGYEADYLASQLRQSTAARVVEFLVPSNPRTVLDLGCGTGRLSLAVREALPETRLSLLDIHEGLLDVARAHFSDDRAVEFHAASFVDLPMSDGSFDAVVSAYAIHHVSDLHKWQTCTEIARVLRPGGVAIVADQMTFDDRIEADPNAINRRIQSAFYAHRNDEGYWLKKLNGGKEFTISGIAMEALFWRTGLICDLHPINDIAGIIIARKWKA